MRPVLLVLWWTLEWLRRGLLAFHRRKYLLRCRPGAKNKKKRQLVKHIWLAMGCAMLIVGQPVWIVSLLLLTTFASFIILDETK
ncbi:hypothetical protein SIN8267_01400 [Sinobacterium norvegicum]|uniref:Uncharacterized protein n=1 Tax=Sinobacterium norvegicum TaxID=1641715 RepID=A0ABM9ADP5_9GAMM|nr:hypothetical protein [Sinobacterium norvegicum]CAH0991298.1 hypothetical protein SIN8267_01400 [Sinobacterium norvegicum]